MENNINGICMLKDHEGDNFEMEKNKLVNNRDFILEQMKTQFQERTRRIEEEILRIEGEKADLLNQAKIIQENMRNFKFEADQKYTSIYSLLLSLIL